MKGDKHTHTLIHTHTHKPCVLTYLVMLKKSARFYNVNACSTYNFNLISLYIASHLSQQIPLSFYNISEPITLCKIHYHRRILNAFADDAVKHFAAIYVWNVMNSHHRPIKEWRKDRNKNTSTVKEKSLENRMTKCIFWNFGALEKVNDKFGMCFSFLLVSSFLFACHFCECVYLFESSQANGWLNWISWIFRQFSIKMLQFTCALICFGCGDNSVDFTLSHDHISAFANVFNHEKYSLCDNLDASDAATDDVFFPSAFSFGMFGFLHIFNLFPSIIHSKRRHK